MKAPDLLAKVLKERYQLKRQLSKKAGRRTLLAFDQEMQRLVILKVLTFSHDLAWEEVRLFQREAELLQTLSHPYIPQYIDAFEFESVASKGYAIVQSYIDAPSLEDHLNAGRCFSEDDARHILESTLKILVYLHTRQPPVIHRDIKPSNILLTDRSGNSPGQVYLVDFGSVQTLANRGKKTMTVVGTYGYMPPEQFGDVACPASDLYSLGAAAIAILTQTHPADLPKAELRIQFEDKVSLQPSFQRWLQRMTAPEVADRPESAEAALRSLTSPQSSPLSPPKPTPLQLPKTPPQLLGDALWRSIRAGVILGTICSGVFSGLLYTFYSVITIGFFAGGLSNLLIGLIGLLMNLILFGAACGVLLGGLNGVLIGILTRLFYFPLSHLQTHRSVCTGASIVVGLAASLLGSLPLTTYPEFAAVMIPTIVLIGALMGLPSYRIVSRWYQRPSEILPNYKNKLQKIG